MRNKRRTIGIFTSLLGFCLIFLNGIGNMQNWDISTPGLLIAGVVLFVLGGIAFSKPISEQTN